MVDRKPRAPVGRPRKTASAPAVAPDAAPPIKMKVAKPAPIKPARVKSAVPDSIATTPAAAQPEPIASAAEGAALTSEPSVDDAIATAVAVPSDTPLTQPIEKGITAMVDTATTHSFVPAGEGLHAMFGDVSTRAKTAMETGAKLAEEMSEFAKGNVEALMTSGRAAAKGAETMSQDAASYSKKSLEHATTAFKGFAAAKSPSELMKLQSDYARSSFDAMVAESSRCSEAMMKLVGEIAQPISSRMALAAEKIKTPAF